VFLDTLYGRLFLKEISSNVLIIQIHIGGKMKDWVEMMKERHGKNILLQKHLEKTVKEKE
jgi:hypothetical protein